MKPFYVDAIDPTDDAMEVRRCIVVGVVSNAGGAVPGALFTLYRKDDGKMFTLSPHGCKFIGFVGDCIMCDHKQPVSEEGESVDG